MTLGLLMAVACTPRLAAQAGPEVAATPPPSAAPHQSLIALAPAQALGPGLDVYPLLRLSDVLTRVVNEGPVGQWAWVDMSRYRARQLTWRLHGDAGYSRVACAAAREAGAGFVVLSCAFVTVVEGRPSAVLLVLEAQTGRVVGAVQVWLDWRPARVVRQVREELERAVAWKSREADGEASFPMSAETAVAVQAAAAKRFGLPIRTGLDLGPGGRLDLVLIPPGMGVRNYKSEVTPPDPHSLGGLASARWGVAMHRTPFYVGTYEVTLRQFRGVMGLPLPPRVDPRLPAWEIKWADAAEFCERVSRQSGWHVRLPTAAEWEYVYRAGSPLDYTTGDTITTRDANFLGPGRKDPDDNSLDRVGRFRPSRWGLYDLDGNVDEWDVDRFMVFEMLGYSRYLVCDGAVPIRPFVIKECYYGLHGGNFRDRELPGASGRGSTTEGMTWMTYGFRVVAIPPTVRPESGPADAATPAEPGPGGPPETNQP